MTTVIYNDPQNATIVPEALGSLREDTNIPSYVTPLDVDTLVNKPILPPVDYTNLDFSAIKSQLLNLLKANSKIAGYTLRDFSDSNTAGMFLNLTAYMGQMISYHTDAMVNELFLDTSQSSWSTFKLLNMFGYKPTRPQPGVILLTIIRRPSANSNPYISQLEDGSEILFSSSLSRKRVTLGAEAFEIFPAKEENGVLVPDILSDFIIPPYTSLDDTSNPDYQMEEMRKNLYLCFGLTGKTVVEDFVSNGTDNQIIRLGSGPVTNSKITVQVEDESVPKRTGKTTYQVWNELTHLSLAGFRSATKVGTSLDGKVPYLTASFKLSNAALILKQQGTLKVGTVMSITYDNMLMVAKYQDFKELLVPYLTCILANVQSESHSEEEYVDVLLYHPSYVYGDAVSDVPTHGVQSTLVNYVWNNGAQIYWEPGDILYLLDSSKYISGSGVTTPGYQPQLVSDVQLALADTNRYPDIAYLNQYPDQRVAVGRALSRDTCAWGLSSDIETFLESDTVYETTTDGDFYASIKFGDGYFGKVPPLNSAIKIIYRVNDTQTTGNIVRAGEANQTITLGSVDLLVRSDYDSSPSVEGENYLLAKDLVTRFYATQDRAVTGTDYSVLVKKFNPNYKVATALSKADADGSIIRIYTLARRFSQSLEKLSPLSLVEKIQLQQFLNSYKCLGVALEFVDGLIRPIDIRIDVRIANGYLAGQVKSDITAAVNSFFDYSKIEMGMGFRATDFIREITQINGLSSCDIYFGGLETLNLGNGNTVILGNKIFSQIKDIPAFSDKSTAFPTLGNTISGIDSVTQQLQPWEILVLDTLTINTQGR